MLVRRWECIWGKMRICKRFPLLIVTFLAPLQRFNHFLTPLLIWQHLTSNILPPLFFSWGRVLNRNPGDISNQVFKSIVGIQTVPNILECTRPDITQACRQFSQRMTQVFRNLHVLQTHLSQVIAVDFQSLHIVQRIAFRFDSNCSLRIPFFPFDRISFFITRTTFSNTSSYYRWAAGPEPNSSSWLSQPLLLNEPRKIDTHLVHVANPVLNSEISPIWQVIHYGSPIAGSNLSKISSLVCSRTSTTT